MEGQVVLQFDLTLWHWRQFAGDHRPALWEIWVWQAGTYLSHTNDVWAGWNPMSRSHRSGSVRRTTMINVMGAPLDQEVLSISRTCAPGVTTQDEYDRGIPCYLCTTTVCRYENPSFYTKGACVCYPCCLTLYVRLIVQRLGVGEGVVVAGG